MMCYPLCVDSLGDSSGLYPCSVRLRLALRLLVDELELAVESWERKGLWVAVHQRMERGLEDVGGVLFSSRMSPVAAASKKEWYNASTILLMTH